MSSKAPVTALPKPCLKQTLGMTFNSQQKHAHFPPASEEAKRYSGLDYDRTPITVIANELALPAKGSPGRIFEDVEDHHHHHRHHHHHHHHPKKADKSDAYKPSSGGDHVHPNYYVSAAAAAISIPMALSPSQLMTGSGLMPPLSTIHGDTSESEGDLSPPLSDSSGSTARAHHPKRLRKANAPDRQQRASGIRLQRTNDSTADSPTSTFASCPGSNSCLGGF